MSGLEMPVRSITGTLLHRAWVKSGRADPLMDAEAWDGFALTVQALAEVEGVTSAALLHRHVEVMGTVLESIATVEPKHIGVATSVGFYRLREWVTTGLRAAEHNLRSILHEPETREVQRA